MQVAKEKGIKTQGHISIEVQVDTSTPEGKRTAEELKAETQFVKENQTAHRHDCEKGNHVRASTGQHVWCLWCAKVLGR